MLASCWRPPSPRRERVSAREGCRSAPPSTAPMDPARSRAQPPGAGRRPVHACGDLRIPRRRPTTVLSRHHDGHHPLAVLVLQRLVRQFGISRVVIGEATTFHGGHDWLAEHGVEIVILQDPDCVAMMTRFIASSPSCGSRTSTRTERTFDRASSRTARHRGAGWGQVDGCRAASKKPISSSRARRYVGRTGSGWGAWASSRASSVRASCSKAGSA